MCPITDIFTVKTDRIFFKFLSDALSGFTLASEIQKEIVEVEFHDSLETILKRITNYYHKELSQTITTDSMIFFFV